MEVGALGRGRSWGRERRGEDGWDGMYTGFLPLRPGGLWYLVVPGGPIRAGGRKAPANLWYSGPTLGGRNTVQDIEAATSAQVSTCYRCRPPPF